MNDRYPGVPTVQITDEVGWPAVPAGWTYAGTTDFFAWYGNFGLVSLKKHCRVYWGSHGCDLHRGHQGHCDCGCCECQNHPDPDSGCVGRYPYYGPETRFYGEDAAARGLPVITEAI